MEMLDLVKVIREYKTLDEKRAIDLRRELHEQWDNLNEEFKEICNKDVKIYEVSREYEKVLRIINFDTKSNFETYAYTANEGLGEEFEEPVYEFNPSDYKKIRKTIENFENDKKVLITKIEKLRNSKTTPFKEQTLKKLEDELKNRQYIVDEYSLALEKQKQKEYYLENKETLVIPVKEQYKELLTNKAKEFLNEKLQENPSLIVAPHHPGSHYSGRALCSVMGEVKNKVNNYLNKENGVRR